MMRTQIHLVHTTSRSKLLLKHTLYIGLLIGFRQWNNQFAIC